MKFEVKAVACGSTDGELYRLRIKNRHNRVWVSRDLVWPHDIEAWVDSVSNTIETGGKLKKKEWMTGEEYRQWAMENI
jgi:hypothetical protein